MDWFRGHFRCLTFLQQCISRKFVRVSVYPVSTVLHTERSYIKTRFNGHLSQFTQFAFRNVHVNEEGPLTSSAHQETEVAIIG